MIAAAAGDVVATGGVVGMLGVILVEFLRRARDVDARADATAAAAIAAAQAERDRALADLAECRERLRKEQQ